VRDGQPVLSETRRSGRFADGALTEASGAVASVGEPGVFWSQNDSGNDAVLFAYDSAGRALARVEVKGAKNRDWEALATGPCNEGQCLTIGDVGDNAALRGKVTLHQLVEPRTSDVRARVIRSLDVRYADGAHDVEAMYAGPDGTLWLITKRPERAPNGTWRPSRLYEVPRAAWSAAEYTAQVVDSLPITPLKGQLDDWVTDASIGPEMEHGEREVVVLTYGAVYRFVADPATGRPFFPLVRCALPIQERTAEGVVLLGSGRVLITTEGRQGALYVGRCP
jgi:hypothetical protein